MYLPIDASAGFKLSYAAGKNRIVNADWSPSGTLQSCRFKDLRASAAEGFWAAQWGTSGIPLFDSKPLVETR
jgi:hypothetical protein